MALTVNRVVWRKQLVVVLAVPLIVAALVCCGAQEKHEDELAQLTLRFQKEWNRLQESAGFPGGTAAFVLPEGQNAAVATGFADVEEKTPMTPHSRLPSGSIGKTFVAAVALSLVQEGALALDRKISVWLEHKPWFTRLPNAEEIALRHLLTHSSGIGDHVYDPKFLADLKEFMKDDPDGNFPPEQCIQYILDQKPLFAPGQGWAYTDTGYLLVGLIIEQVTNSSYYEELQTRFLEPLELMLTGPSDRREIPGLASGYAAEENLAQVPILRESGETGPKKMVMDGAMIINPAFEWTGGGLVTNALDLAKWAKLLYEGDAIEGEYLEMLLNGVPRDLDNANEGRYGLGVFINDTPFGTMYGHGGFFPGYLSKMQYFPEHRISIALQINTDGGQDLADLMFALAKVVLGTGLSQDN